MDLDKCKWCKGVDSYQPGVMMGFQGLVNFGSSEVTLICAGCEGTGLSERRLQALKLAFLLKQIIAKPCGQPEPFISGHDLSLSRLYRAMTSVLAS